MRQAGRRGERWTGRVWAALREHAEPLADLAMPLSCAGCAAAGVRWCADCAGQVPRFVGGPRRVAPDPPPAGMPRCWASCAYEGSVRRLVSAVKDEDRVDLTGVLGDLVALAATRALQEEPELRWAPPERLAVVPVPSSRGARRRRGRDVSRELAALVAAACPPGVAVAPALRLVRRTADQSGLTSAERAANLERAMGVSGQASALEGRVVLLVDDVVTTGATLTEAARVLRSAGARAVVAVTAAATQRARRLPPTGGEASVWP